MSETGVSAAGASEVELPELVRRYLERSLPGDRPVPRQVRVTQVGEMRQKPDGRWLRFKAVEELAVQEVAFSWRARFSILPLLSLRVVDRFAAREGLLEARLLGFLPVMRARGPEVAHGEALRYLAELVWVPQAMLVNRQLEWRELDEQSVEVATQLGSAKAAVRLEFDAAGDVVSTWCDARPYREGKTSVPRPWAGRFSDYARLGGIRIPTHGEVRWELTEGPFTYWRGTITSIELDPSP